MSILLSEAISRGILDLTVIERQLNAMKKQEYLNKHPYAIYQGKNGRWYTYLPDRSKSNHRRQITRTSRADLETEIVNCYKQQEISPTIEQIFDEWQARRLYLQKVSQATITRDQYIFKRHFSEFGKRKILSVRPEDCINFLEEQIPIHHLSRKGFSNLKGVLKGILKKAKRDGLIDYNVETIFADLDVNETDFRNRVRSDEDEIFYDQEVNAILKYCFAHQSDMRCVAVALMFVSGLRVGEVVVLKCSDICNNAVYVKRTETRYKENGIIHFEVKDYPKTPAGVRKVMIPAKYSWVLTAMLEANNPDYIFIGRNGNRLRTENIRRKQATICKELGIPPRSPHKDRKTYGSILLDAGLDAKLIERQMGHTNITCTETFYHRDRRSDEEKSRLINAVFERPFE